MQADLEAAIHAGRLAAFEGHNDGVNVGHWVLVEMRDAYMALHDLKKHEVRANRSPRESAPTHTSMRCHSCITASVCHATPYVCTCLRGRSSSELDAVSSSAPSVAAVTCWESIATDDGTGLLRAVEILMSKSGCNHEQKM